MAEIFIYSSQSLREARGNLEDDLEEFLGERGEVTGGGGGGRGWNVDLEVEDTHLPMLIEKISLFLSGWGVPPDTFFDVYIEEADEEKSSRHYVFNTREVLDWIDTTLTFIAKRVGHDSHEWTIIKTEVTAMLEAKSAQSTLDL